jgi:hypothetical protein
MYKLSEETKKHLSEVIGIPYEKLITMDHDEITAYIEQKNGKKMGYYTPDARFSGSGDDSVLIDCGKYRTMEDVDREMDKIIRKPRLLDKFKSYLSKKEVKKYKGEITREKVSPATTSSTFDLAKSGSEQMKSDCYTMANDETTLEK